MQVVRTILIDALTKPFAQFVRTLRTGEEAVQQGTEVKPGTSDYGNDPLPRDPRHDSADHARPGPWRASVPSFPVQRGPPGAGSRRAALAAESPLRSLGLKLAGVGRLLDAGIRLASPPPREPLGEEQAERRDEREHEQYQGQAEEGGPGQFHHGRHGEQRQRGELDQEERREEKRPIKDRVRRNRRWPVPRSRGRVFSEVAAASYPGLLLLEVATVVFRASGKEREEVARHQPYESGSETPNAIKIAMRAKQAPVSRSVLILGMKSMK